jgi:hypothetical protein
MICLFILYIFPFQKVENLNLNYSLFELIELISIYCVLFICIGSSSLYIYQKFVSLINQIIGKEEKETKDMQKMFSILGIFWISYTSMYFKNYLNYIIVKNFNKSNNKRKLLFLMFLIYIISFIISFILQLVIDYMRKEESFKLDCNCCNNCICCCNCCIQKCCKCCCCRKNQNKKTVLKLKKTKCDICGYIYYKENWEKIEVNVIDDESNTLISDIAVVIDKYKFKKLFEKKYSFIFYFKYKNILSWIYVTFIKLNTIILIILNLFLNMQTIGLKEYYVDILNNQYTIEKCYKDLVQYYINCIVIGTLSYIILIMLMLIQSIQKYLKNLKILYLTFFLLL